MDEKYNLQWKKFSNHLTGAFKDLGTDGHFADVTLVSDDQIQTRAHKVVLSACSPVLRTFLINNPHSHPLLYLRGIKNTELKAIIQFMYFGETDILESGINEFLAVAKDLDLKEISQSDEEHEYPAQDQNLKEIRLRDDQQEDKKQHQNISKTLPTSRVDDQSICHEISFNEGDEVDEKQITKTIAVNEYKRIANNDVSFSCDECEKKYAQSYNLDRHKKSKHAGVRFSCIKCDIQFTQQSNLDRHSRKLH